MTGEQIMANEKTEQEKAAEKLAAAKLESAKTPMPAKDAPTETKAPNLTRDSIEGALYGRYLNEGKSPEDAKRMAKQRAIEMIP